MISETTNILIGNTWWLRHAANPVLPPGAAGTFDCGCCMNPWVMRVGDTYHLYYAGADAEGFRRICTAVASVDNPTTWQRLGPRFDVGVPGSFDARWCVLPHVIEMASGRLHLYYTANCGVGEGLSAFPGIGLAISTDGGTTWEKYADNPIIAPTHRTGDPDAIGIAGGSVLRVRLSGGGTEWRYYYTGCPTLGDDLFLDQQKRACLAVSADGIHWERRGAVMLRDPEHDYENVAVAGPVVHQREDGTFRMWYSAIGTRWGAYSIGYAESADGYHWQRGAGYGDNLQLGSSGTGWEAFMVEYPSVIREGDHLRLFYCGNGYGATGIGTAVSAPLRATVGAAGTLCLVAGETGGQWIARVSRHFLAREGTLRLSDASVRWHGPDAHGMLWHEGGIAEDGTTPARGDLERSGLHYRLQLRPHVEGIEVRMTVMHFGATPLHDLAIDALLGDGIPTATCLLGDVQPGDTITGCGILSLAEGAVRWRPQERA